MDNAQHAASLFNKYAQQYQDKFMDTSMYHDSFDVFCNLIKVTDANVLELACGPGNITRYLLSKRADLKILGIDLAPNMISLARLNNPNAVFEVMDSRSISTLNKKFDALVCGFCLPYLSMEETEQLFADAAGMLNEGSPVYISTMEDDYSSSGFRKGSAGDEIFMHFYTEKDLTRILEQNNFTVMKALRKTYGGPDNSVVTDLLMVAVKS